MALSDTPSQPLLLCRVGWESTLQREFAQHSTDLGQVGSGAVLSEIASVEDDATVGRTGPGWLALPGIAQLPGAALMFERQRLPQARWLAGSRHADLAAAIVQIAAHVGEPQDLHVYAPDAGEPEAPVKEARALERRLLREAPQWLRAPDDATRPATPRGPPPRHVVQVALLPSGCWVDASPRHALSSPWPAGVHRLAHDPHAPSRSFLKLEEAFALMDQEPRAGDSAVDLGAAPGGWTYALLKRGCQVLAVDNGPLKLREEEQLPGQVRHLRVDGLSFTPPQVPLDWLVADMLVPPGAALGLLRRWLGQGWARRAVVNIKLPQRDPLAALAPLRGYLGSVRGLAWRLRQLYHDRREVTLLATQQGPLATTVVAERPPRPGRGTPTPRPPAADARRPRNAAERPQPKARKRPATPAGRKRPATGGRKPGTHRGRKR